MYDRLLVEGRFTVEQGWKANRSVGGERGGATVSELNVASSAEEFQRPL